MAEKAFLLKEGALMDFNIGDVKTASVEWLKDDSTPGKVDEGSTVWESSDTTICTVVPTGDLSASVSFLAEGSCVLSVRADADLGDGVTEVEASVDVTVLGHPVTSGRISFN